MGRTDRADDIPFRLDFAGDGTAKLRLLVREKLKEFMGEYTDDTLVEYVIVLLKNGRRKEAAKNELNVFLGDDSDSFVSWLWEHLQSNLDLYAEPAESFQNDKRPVSEDQTAKNGYKKLDSEPEREKNKLPKIRHNREWKGLSRNEDDPPILRSVVTTNAHLDGNAHHKVVHAEKSQPVIPKKRSRSDEETNTKQQEPARKPAINASRRLLQFAVRDAVIPSTKLFTLSPEPSLKRLRSVVSTSNPNHPITDHTENLQAQTPQPVIMNLIKVRPSRNVFDRLGRAIDDLQEQKEVPRLYVDVNALDDRVLDTSQVGLSGKNNVKSHQPITAVNTHSKMVSISADMNEGASAGKSGQQLMKESSSHILVGNGNTAVTVADSQKKHQNAVSSTPGLNFIGRPTDITDSRSIFVSNVHFAATKDGLSRHFNKFGDVLKVIILTDLTTGQPKGSAYVEFLRKEAAEHALALNGTSFMSRILKVVKKSSAPPKEAVPIMSLPHMTRGSPFVGFRFSRGVPSIYRPQIHLNVGGNRSMQWKRDGAAQTTASDSTVPSPSTARSLTYVRKTDS
jgi:hypothetical protein